MPLQPGLMLLLLLPRQLMSLQLGRLRRLLLLLP
jgi:hypothetical protein